MSTSGVSIHHATHREGVRRIILSSLHLFQMSKEIHEFLAFEGPSGVAETLDLMFCGNVFHCFISFMDIFPVRLGNRLSTRRSHDYDNNNNL